MKQKATSVHVCQVTKIFVILLQLSKQSCIGIVAMDLRTHCGLGYCTVVLGYVLLRCANV